MFPQQTRENQKLYYHQWALKVVARSKVSSSLYWFARSNISLYVEAVDDSLKSYRFKLFHQCQYQTHIRIRWTTINFPRIWIWHMCLYNKCSQLEKC